jgi:hypothetical protein
VNKQLEKILYNLDVQRGMADGPDPDYEKYSGDSDFEYGCAVAIEWGGELEGETDYGYIFGLPGIEEDDPYLGGIVHVPHPRNPGGKDAADPEWVTLYELGCNPIVKRIRKLEQAKEAGEGEK